MRSVLRCVLVAVCLLGPVLPSRTQPLALASATCAPRPWDGSPLPAPAHVPRPDQPAASAVDLVLDEGVAAELIQPNNGDKTHPFIALNRFTPRPAAFPITLHWLSVLFGSPALNKDRHVRLLVYADADGDGNPSNAVLVAGQDVTIADTGKPSFQTFPIDVTISEPGDIYVGFATNLTCPAADWTHALAVADGGAGERRSWILHRSNGAAPDLGDLSVDDHRYLIAGNWLIRAGGVGSEPSTVTDRVQQYLAAGGGLSGLYLKQVHGPVLAARNEHNLFEPASAIKVLLHLYAMRRVETGPITLDYQVPKLPGGQDCPLDLLGNPLPPKTQSLDDALRQMMRDSDNGRTLAISNTFGLDRINAMAREIVGMTDTSINHALGCRSPDRNTMTLVDAAALYEGVAEGRLLHGDYQRDFFEFMAGSRESSLPNDDIIFSGDLPTMIDQEAPAIDPAWLAEFKRQLRLHGRLAYKDGAYDLQCAPGDCTRFVNHAAIFGWVKIPWCEAGAFASREFVFGWFVKNATTYANALYVLQTTRSELLREQIHTALVSCRDHGPPAPSP